MVALFSQAGQKDQLPARIRDLAQVSVGIRDALPQYICHSCRCRLVTLVKAVVELVAFRRQAQES